MASGGSGGPPGPLGITLPDWMKRKTPDRYAFEETPFSPPSPNDEYFLIKYPFKGEQPEKKSAYETINSLTAAGINATRGKKAEAGSADALPLPSAATEAGGASAATSALSSLSIADKDQKEGKVRRNSAVTVLPGGQVSIKTYGESSSPLKKSSDPGAYYGDYSNLHSTNARLSSDVEMPLAPGDFHFISQDDPAYDSDCSVASSSAAAVAAAAAAAAAVSIPGSPPVFGESHFASAVGGESGLTSASASAPESPALTTTILGAIGHHLHDLTTGGHGIMDYFHNQEAEDNEFIAPTTMPPALLSMDSSTPPPSAGGGVAPGDRARRIGLGTFPAPVNPFFVTDGSAMSMFSGLYGKDSKDGPGDAKSGALVSKAAHEHNLQLEPSGGAGPGKAIVSPEVAAAAAAAAATGSFAANRSSSAYDSQLTMASGASADAEMEMLTRMAKDRGKRWVPKPSKHREMNLFAPCST